MSANSYNSLIKQISREREEDKERERGKEQAIENKKRPPKKVAINLFGPFLFSLSQLGVDSAAIKHAKNSNGYSGDWLKETT